MSSHSSSCPGTCTGFESLTGRLQPAYLGTTLCIPGPQAAERIQANVICCCPKSTPWPQLKLMDLVQTMSPGPVWPSGLTGGSLGCRASISPRDGSASLRHTLVPKLLYFKAETNFHKLPICPEIWRGWGSLQANNHVLCYSLKRLTRPLQTLSRSSEQRKHSS